MTPSLSYLGVAYTGEITPGRSSVPIHKMLGKVHRSTKGRPLFFPTITHPFFIRLVCFGLLVTQTRKFLHLLLCTKQRWSEQGSLACRSCLSDSWRGLRRAQVCDSQGPT